MNSKLKGSTSELLFAVECMKRGATVSLPFGNTAFYDLLVDTGRKIWKVQVKTARRYKTGWMVNTSRRIPNSNGSSDAVAYTSQQIDLVVTRTGHEWYFFRNINELPHGVQLNPVGTSKHNKHVDRWDYMKLPL